jgi:hypothetical protein
LFLERAKVRGIHRQARIHTSEFGGGLRSRIEARGLFVRERLQQYTIDDGEYCRDGADPQRQGQNGKCGERFLATKECGALVSFQ